MKPSTSPTTPLKVGVIMGSRTDLPVMERAVRLLGSFGVGVEARIVSAHRTPEVMFRYAREAEGRGMGVVIAGAGGAAHLPGMVASLTPLPVIGVPIVSTTNPSSGVGGVDSLLSIVQMPKGVPVATVAINGAENAAHLALRMLGLRSPDRWAQVKRFMEEEEERIRGSDADLRRWLVGRKER